MADLFVHLNTIIDAWLEGAEQLMGGVSSCPAYSAMGTTVREQKIELGIDLF